MNDTSETKGTTTTFKSGDLVVVNNTCPREELRGAVFFIHGKVPDVVNIPENSGTVCISSPLLIPATNFGMRVVMDPKNPHRTTVPLRWLTRAEDYCEQ